MAMTLSAQRCMHCLGVNTFVALPSPLQMCCFNLQSNQKRSLLEDPLRNHLAQQTDRATGVLNDLRDLSALMDFADELSNVCPCHRHCHCPYHYKYCQTCDLEMQGLIVHRTLPCVAIVKYPSSCANGEVSPSDENRCTNHVLVCQF